MTSSIRASTAGEFHGHSRIEASDTNTTFRHIDAALYELSP